jgi:hypothetical protein
MGKQPLLTDAISNGTYALEQLIAARFILARMSGFLAAARIHDCHATTVAEIKADIDALMAKSLFPGDTK